ncbi:ABC transporter ATP-binding protein [Candidatus Falkowbacteria bacterium]|jgi:ATP-binding cassette, subfamily B, bacterial|nr:ABC transporter ATP-binding protein [Candidatus Falkowbacteria bacterium]MBT4432818.1 ABC transporter ATP-binding protein [Candidatus Falkowbacteria bacterium]
MIKKNLKKHINYTNIELIKDVWSFIKPYKAKFFLGSIIRITSDLVWLFPVWVLSEIITFVSNYQSGDSTLYVWQLLGATAVVALYYFITHELCKYYIYQIAENIGIDARKNTTRYLYSLNMDWHEKENTGNKMQKILQGGESLKRIIRMYINTAVKSTINLIAIVIILAFFNIFFAVLLILFFITYYLLSYHLTKKAVDQAHICNLEWENFSGISFESINNISIVKSLRIGEKIYPFLVKISQRLSEKIKKRIFYFRIREGSLNLYQEFFRIVLVVFTLWQIFQGNLEVGILAMVILYFGKIEASAYEFAATYNEFVTAKIAMFRMKEILRTKPTVEKSGTKLFNPDWQKLTLKNINFSYRGQKVLKNFSLEIKKGEKIGIVGISGTGKSTLFKLILKLYDDYGGSIMFDKNSLHDIKRSSYMEKVAVVPQETELFNLSLEENITLSQTGKNQKLLQKALDIAHVKDFSYKLPKGVKSLVGEKGIKLSGGEKQRVGIARAIYREPEILLLDEATSHLDIESEKKIQETLHTFFQDITVIVVAHRLSTIKEMDRIVVMDKGEVLEVGTFDELIARKGKFYKLWEKQKF